MTFSADTFQEKINSTITRLVNEKVVERIWEKDFTVWSNKPDEIVNRLGWLISPDVTKKSFDEIKNFVAEIRAEGFTHALLMGMGGSSLAPEVFRLTFGVKEGYLDLSVLDTTDPSTILSFEEKLEPSKTLYIVSTKSGGTVETISFMKYFYNSVMSKLGKEKAGNHFIAITDPGSGLQQMAIDLRFRKIFLNDPEIGGRYSALSLFGIVPAALIGVDVEKIISAASSEAVRCKKSGLNINDNQASILGIMLGIFAEAGKNKVTFLLSEKIKSFGGWAEQLIAESTGKIGKGILPVDLEEHQLPENYGTDRVFVNVRLEDDLSNNSFIQSIKSSERPVIEIVMDDEYDLGKEFFRWEFATAIAGWYLSIQPFDQPNVEEAKVIARRMVKEYQEKGKLPELIPTLNQNGIKVYSDVGADNVSDAVKNFLDGTNSGKNYVAIHAYLKPGERIFKSLQVLRTKILEKYKAATTLGFGPRFLHSTGQLHKGDDGSGYFIQIINIEEKEAAIPDNAGSNETSISFGILIRAQALGDRQVLIDNNRKVLTLEISGNAEKVIENLF
ncbi:MAG: glucose-6-phosphate isomerase [Ignavibacteriales bacterium]|nr:MAG: glucose-6-phosphate isomerase [Ignavibacteriales bacterium]